MAITPLPTPPSRQDSANFSSRGDAFMAALPAFVVEANILQADVAENTAIAQAAVDAALANANFVGNWSSLSGALNIPASVRHAGFVWMLLNNVVNVAAETPGVSSAWMKIEAAGNLGSAAYSNVGDFQPAIGAINGILAANGAGAISAATAAQIVAAIGATAVQASVTSQSANTAGACTGNAATATTAAACSGNAATASDASALGGIPAAGYPSFVTASPDVRQTVLSGPVDASGNAAFGGSTGASTVTASGTLRATAAAGGDANRTGSIVNPSWSGLSTNGTMYLYLDIAADGTVTTGSTTLAPVYQWGGSYSTVSGQHTYNIQESTMKVGNGSTSSQVYRVFVGKVTVSGGVVASITWHALRGRYYVEQATIASSTAYSFNHNIGTNLVACSAWLECKTADIGFSVGDRIDYTYGDSNGTQQNGAPVWWNADQCGATMGTGLLQVPHKSTGAVSSSAMANWKLGIFLKRAW